MSPVSESSIGQQVEVILDISHPLGAIATEAEWQSWFQIWLQALEVNQSPIGLYEVGLQLTDDTTVHQLNAAYRQQDKPTDVLSFAALEDEAPQIPELLKTEPLYLGDIIISLDTAQRQATEQGHSLRQETLWLTVHGFLHLLGWDHLDDKSLVKMLSKQAELLEQIGIPQEKFELD